MTGEGGTQTGPDKPLSVFDLFGSWGSADVVPPGSWGEKSRLAMPAAATGGVQWTGPNQDVPSVGSFSLFVCVHVFSGCFAVLCAIALCSMLYCLGVVLATRVCRATYQGCKHQVHYILRCWSHSDTCAFCAVSLWDTFLQCRMY